MMRCHCRFLSPASLYDLNQRRALQKQTLSSSALPAMSEVLKTSPTVLTADQFKPALHIDSW